jgi:hypothetical protein
MLYVMCLCILVSLRIPRYDLVKQTFISDVVLSHIYHHVYLSTETIGVAATPMIQATATMSHFNTYMTSSALGAPYIEGEYVSYLELINMPPQLLGNYALMECQIMKTYEFNCLLNVLGVTMNFK